MQPYFEKLRTNLELTPSFDERVQTRHNAVRAALEIQNSKLVGSMQRRTRIQPRPQDRFDIDILVIRGDFKQWARPGEGITPRAALDALFERVKDSDRYSKKHPEHDAPTITLNFADDMAVELIPGWVDQIGSNSNGEHHEPKGRAYWIPRGEQWELADYDFDAQYITDQNLASNGWLVPTIKMLKAIKRLHFPTFKSYALEILAARIVRASVNAYGGQGRPISFPELLRLFFAHAIDLLHYPIEIPGSLSVSVTLPALETPGHAATFAFLRDHISEIMELHESAKIERWRAIFGDSFPKAV